MEFRFCQHIEFNSLTQLICFGYDQTISEIARIGAIIKSQ
jgi:hypothetical protein